MAYLCILVVVVVVVALPFALIKQDGPRVRLYLLVCAAPCALYVPACLSARLNGSAYGTLVLILISFLLSISLTLVGAVLLVHSRHVPRTRRYIAVGLLLAALPLILIDLVGVS